MHKLLKINKRKIIIALLTILVCFIIGSLIRMNIKLADNYNNLLLDYTFLKNAYDNTNSDKNLAIEIINMMEPYATEEHKKIIEDFRANKSISSEEFVDSFNQEMNDITNNVEEQKKDLAAGIDSIKNGEKTVEEVIQLFKEKYDMP